MGAITPDSVERISFGSVTGIIGTFSTTTIDTADTWDTGLGTNAKFAWASTTTINPVLSSGTVTFYTLPDNRVGDVFILANA